MTKKKIIIASASIGIVVAAGAFWGGMAYGKNSVAAAVTASRAARGNFQGGFAGGRTGAAGGFTSGQIISKDDKSITVSLPAGGSKIVFLGGSVKISKQVDGSINDLSTGAQVQIMGTANPDGSITASSVQLRSATAAVAR